MTAKKDALQSIVRIYYNHLHPHVQTFQNLRAIMRKMAISQFLEQGHINFSKDPKVTVLMKRPTIVNIGRTLKFDRPANTFLVILYV